ncbi:MAG: hypothetical protein OJF51_000017 [Nitrospira sp.]|nr:MAG: hypothetical protein OJF51_000017 [Nitrospira sp.]
MKAVRKFGAWMNQLNIKEIIGNIEKRIDDHRFVNARITSEINILSLNATIEAARTGDACSGTTRSNQSILLRISQPCIGRERR